MCTSRTRSSSEKWMISLEGLQPLYCFWCLFASLSTKRILHHTHSRDSLGGLRWDATARAKLDTHPSCMPATASKSIIPFSCGCYEHVPVICDMGELFT